MEIYVADLHDYNAGVLRGKWIDVEFATEDDIWKEIKAMLAEKPGHEEWAIHDYDEFPKLGENPDIATVAKVAKLIDDNGLDIVREFINHNGTEMLDRFDELCYGTYKDKEDFAASYSEGMGEIPSWVEMYIDYDRMADDLMCGEFWGVDTTTGFVVFVRG